MKIITYPSPDTWNDILLRPAFDQAALLDKVKDVMQDVKQTGDEAIRKYTVQFDGVDIADPLVTQQEIDAAESRLSETLISAIQQAAANITRFHEQQREKTTIVETMPGVSCWRKSVGIDKVGLYIPGGSAPLFSTILMLAIPAKIAGCKEVILCSPPGKDGQLHPAILYAAKITGIQKLYKIGGVQAIAAMTYGTATIPKVYKIFGPGNQYVTCAKQLALQEGVAIDMPAGPSEVCVLADDSAKAAFVAADLLSQAEHGADSQVLLVTTYPALLEKVQTELQKQLHLLPRKEIAAKAMENSTLVLVKNNEEAIAFVNAYAAEHLIIACHEAEKIAERITNAGSVFLGNYSPESVGDYASGTNHTLPTNGYARAYSGVSLDSFVKKITYQRLSREGLDLIGRTVMVMADAEGLEAHAHAVRVRVEYPE
ncbi:MAG: histidinol dehydrogenase [Bacteroidota bacterium]|nr:histidinol dehydrogenase [Bacteroidota bacterium]